MKVEVSSIQKKTNGYGRWDLMMTYFGRERETLTLSIRFTESASGTKIMHPFPLDLYFCRRVLLLVHTCCFAQSEP